MSQHATDAATPKENTVEPVVESPYCREIRSKRYYFLAAMPTEVSDIRDSSNNCWCGATRQAVGPDGELARPEDCIPGRACYVSLFAE